MASPQPQWTPGVGYRPRRQLGRLTDLRTVRIGAIQLGDTAAATCPTRSYWWLALAAVAGAVGGYKYSRAKKKRPGRRG